MTISQSFNVYRNWSGPVSSHAKELLQHSSEWFSVWNIAEVFRTSVIVSLWITTGRFSSHVVLQSCDGPLLAHQMVSVSEIRPRDWIEHSKFHSAIQFRHKLCHCYKLTCITLRSILWTKESTKHKQNRTKKTNNSVFHIYLFKIGFNYTKTHLRSDNTKQVAVRLT
jgi:hypothetical protein